jgi:predicted permease
MNFHPLDRLRRFYSRRKTRVDFPEEIRFHRDRLIEDFLASGLTRAEAERRALLEFGGVPQIEEAVRDVRGRWLEDLAKDLRYALRTLGRNPGFSVVAVLLLALGIGANAAIFSLINAVMLRTLPVKEPGRLVQIARISSEDAQPVGASYPMFEYIRDHVRSISGASAHASADLAIAIDGDEEFLAADLVTGAYYGTLGLDPIAGRLLTPADDDPASATTAAVISERFWKRRFGRSPAAIGKALTIHDRAFVIVGVTPASFQSVQPGRVADITIPQVHLIGELVGEKTLHDPTSYWLSLVGRLKPGVTVDQANAEVQVLWRAFLQPVAAAEPEKDRAEILSARAAVLPAADGINSLRYDHRRSLVILMGIVTLVLLLVCVNLSGLQLARAAARQREVSIRLAIGAGRGRLVRQFLTESLLLAAMGGSLGLVVAAWFSARLLRMVANGGTLLLDVAPDGRVLAFTAAMSLVACLVSGLVPSLQAVRVNVNPALKEVRAGAPAHGYRRIGLGQAFVVAQLAISMVLIVGATLFVGTLRRLYAVDRGFDSHGVLVVDLRDLRSSRPYSDERSRAVKRALIERLRSTPGIAAASATQILPLGGSLWTKDIRVEGRVSGPGRPDGVARTDGSDTSAFNVVGPAYFSTLGTRVVAGREFDDRDRAQSPKVTIVNESFARFFFGAGPGPAAGMAGSPALGRRVTVADVPYEIVGVVRDAKYRSLRDLSTRTMYVSWMQRTGDGPSDYVFLARVATGDPLRFGPTLDRLVREVDPALHVRATYSYASLVDRSLVTERIMATLGGAFGLLALIVAALGVFGVLAFQVARRTSELGVRTALGATPWSLTRLVLSQVAWMTLPGIVIGAGVALLMTGLARHILFELTPTEPRVFLVAALVLAAAAALAGWIPARRAAHVDPLIALREE